ncbi:MAG: hypothetical protein ANABAC_1216 [Anaerolineae bacterium]|nr:MAG: hypothetical protein ANABAC_1216 [Anaerolineae bacterium]
MFNNQLYICSIINNDEWTILFWQDCWIDLQSIGEQFH